MNTFHRIAVASLHDFPNPAMHEQPLVSTTPLSFSIIQAVCIASLTLWVGCTAAFRNINLLRFYNFSVTVQVAVCFCASDNTR